LVEFVQVISVGQPSTARENCPATRGPGQWTQARAGERHRKTSEARIQSWRRPVMARAGGGGAKRPTQREAPRARSRAVSVRTSAKGAHARSAGGRASASTSAGGGNARSAGGRASASTSASGAHARSAGGRASASTSASGAHARSAGGRASASTSAGGATARSAGGRASGGGDRGGTSLFHSTLNKRRGYVRGRACSFARGRIGLFQADQGATGTGGA
jgi:hypothetical protein